MTEADLILFIRNDFNKIGYVTYGEVSPNAKGGEKRCDMYARIEDKKLDNYGHTIAFEAKTTFSFKVLEQAYKWKKHANNVYIIVPVGKKSTRKSQRFIANKLGIGVIEVDLINRRYTITVKSEYNNKPKYPKLFKEQREISSSVNNGEFITEFKLTIKRIDEYMKNKQQTTLSDIINNVKTHYKSKGSATNAIKKYIETKVIVGYEIIKIKNRLIIKNLNYGDGKN